LSGCAIRDRGKAGLAGAVGATIHISGTFDAVADDSAMATGALRRQSLNSTFEAVEKMFFVIYGYGEAFVVVVSTHFTSGHRKRSSCMQ
jgi:hypothetical protein